MLYKMDSEDLRPLETRVIDAIIDGDVDLLCVLLDEDENLAIANGDVYNPLVIACQSTNKNSAKIVGYLLRAGADPNHIAEDRNLPLHVAIRNNSQRCGVAIIKKLLKYDADPNIHVEGKDIFNVIEEEGRHDLLLLFEAK